MISFIDSGVLITAARSTGDLKEQAEEIIRDKHRQLASSVFVRLEVLPKPVHFKRISEVKYYEAFFRRVSIWAEVDEELLATSLRQAELFGIAALDALHIAAALHCNADEFVTTEKPTKPLHRVQGIKVTTIHR